MASLLVVLACGFLLSEGQRREATRRGLAAGTGQAVLVAETGVLPLLDGQPLDDGLTPAERVRMARLVGSATGDGTILRLRLRGTDGRVVYPTDGSGRGQPDDDALEALAEDRPVSEVARLNVDSGDSGAPALDAVEVYLPLDHPRSGRAIGVLEVYLPYAPIAEDIAGGLHALRRDLVLSLGVLYLLLAALAATTSRALRREARRTAYLAEHDQLTGLPNRTSFQQRVDAHSGGSGGRAPVVALLDLDRFKEVNESLGHGNGDALLVEVGRRLAGRLRPGDVVARLGADEFGLLLTRVASETEARTALERLRSVAEEPITLAGLPVSLEASVGFAVAPDDGTDAELLVRRADIALRVAKAGRRGVVRYSGALDSFDPDRLALVAELRRALGQGELTLHYQPITRLGDGRLDEVEALVRWHHPTRGLLFPADFLPLAEQTGLIEPLTDWVVERALAQVRAWDLTLGEVRAAVNVSARNLGDPTFTARVRRHLETAGLPAHRLVLEVTETALFADPPRAAAILRDLDALGVQISLDDFGQGQTSLRFLSELALRQVKIDREFVTDMTRSAPHAAIVRSVIDLAHHLGFEVVAEGVEDEHTLAALRTLDCDAAQGYLLTRPLPAEDLARWARTSTWSSIATVP